MRLISRGEAQAQGLTRYFNGNPCKHGHVAERLTTSCTCIVCHRAHWRDSKKRKPEEFRRIQRRAQQKRYHANIEKSRDRVRVDNWKRAGIVPTRPCPKRCECCQGRPTGKGQLHADHDHATKKFRGWICSKCNLGIGSLGDTIAGLRRAIRYLELAR